MISGFWIKKTKDRQREGQRENRVEIEYYDINKYNISFL